MSDYAFQTLVPFSVLPTSADSILIFHQRKIVYQGQKNTLFSNLAFHRNDMVPHLLLNFPIYCLQQTEAFCNYGDEITLST